MHHQKLAGKSTLVAAVCVVATLAPLYYVSYHFRLGHPYGGAARLPLEDFEHDWLGSQAATSFDLEVIRSHCNHTEWRPNLVLNLYDANGGVGNVRANVLDFCYFAIQAGASIVLPSMATRSEDGLGNEWEEWAPFDYLFDEQWFFEAMRQACPHMTIYRPEVAAQTLPKPLGLHQPRSMRVDRDASNTFSSWRGHFDDWLSEQPHYDASNLTLVELGRSMWEVDTRSLPANLRRDFGMLLRLRPDMRQLAASAVRAMTLRYGLSIDPLAPIPANAFYGAHLRAHEDAPKSGLPGADRFYGGLEAQSDVFIEQARRYGLDVIYAATDNETHAAYLAEKAGAHGINVTTKWQLLGPEAGAALRRLPCDVQALVDYAVMLRCSHFSGLAHSSVAYALAISRAQRLEDLGRVVDPWAVTLRDPTIAYEDELSRIFSRNVDHEARAPRGSWP